MEKTLVQASGDVFSKALEHPKMHDGFPPQDGAYSCSSRDGSMRFSQYSLVMHNKHVLRLLQVATECVWSGRSYVKLHGQAVICASWCMEKGFVGARVGTSDTSDMAQEVCVWVSAAAWPGKAVRETVARVPCE